MSPPCCPHCGGQSGIVTDVVMKARCLYRWTGKTQDNEDYSVMSETSPRCLDCNRLVRAQFNALKKAP